MARKKSDQHQSEHQEHQDPELVFATLAHKHHATEHELGFGTLVRFPCARCGDWRCTRVLRRRDLPADRAPNTLLRTCLKVEQHFHHVEEVIHLFEFPED